MASSSYTISVPESRINTLKQKLALATFPDEVRDLTVSVPSFACRVGVLYHRIR